jgi:hypothetical protein
LTIVKMSTGFPSDVVPNGARVMLGVRDTDIDAGTDDDVVAVEAHPASAANASAAITP